MSLPSIMECEQFSSIVADLKEIKPCGSYITARCPAHDDSHRSLSVRIGSNGALLVKCHANKGCTFADIAKALGRKPDEFFPPTTPEEKFARQKPNEVYDYRDADGSFLFRTVRTATKQFWVERQEGGKWVRNRDGIKNVPYRLPELLVAPVERVIWIVEGERKVHSLEALGLIATCNAGGAGKWDGAWAPHFKGRAVAIIPDNDEAGWKHAWMVASKLATIAAPIRIVDLPGLGLKDDIVDWLAMYPDQDVALDILMRMYELSPIYGQDSSQISVAMMRLALSKLLVSFAT